MEAVALITFSLLLKMYETQCWMIKISGISISLVCFLSSSPHGMSFQSIEQRPKNWDGRNKRKNTVCIMHYRWRQVCRTWQDLTKSHMHAKTNFRYAWRACLIFWGAACIWPQYKNTRRRDLHGYLNWYRRAGPKFWGALSAFGKFPCVCSCHVLQTGVQNGSSSLSSDFQKTLDLHDFFPF